MSVAKSQLVIRVGKPILSILWLLVLGATVLAGCAESTGDEELDNGPSIDATETTGGIRGVVVDQAIVPVQGVTVVVDGLGITVETDESGLFLFEGLDAGTYFLTASHPLYDVVQQSAVVEAGVSRPPAVRIQLTRLIAEDPYVSIQQFNGNIFCSANVVGAYSEECGEGVGIPRSSCFLINHPGGCVSNPVMPGERVLKNPSNAPGQEWYVDSPNVQTFVIEQTWEPSLEVSASGGGQFRTFYGINWVCDPFCGADHGFGQVVANSPLYAQVLPESFEGLNYTSETRFTTFTYAADNPGLIVEQPYELFVSTSYFLPLPEGWSFLNGDERPF